MRFSFTTSTSQGLQRKQKLNHRLRYVCNPPFEPLATSLHFSSPLYHQALLQAQSQIALALSRCCRTDGTHTRPRGSSVRTGGPAGCPSRATTRAAIRPPRRPTGCPQTETGRGVISRSAGRWAWGDIQPYIRYASRPCFIFCGSPYEHLRAIKLPVFFSSLFKCYLELCIHG
jgi:hypothetical protein